MKSRCREELKGYEKGVEGVLKSVERVSRRAEKVAKGCQGE
jgi:hypothetical protein